MSCAKTAKPIEMPFWTLSGGPKKPRSRLGTDPPLEGEILTGERHVPTMPDNNDVNCGKMAESIEMPFGLWTQVDVLDWAQIPYVQGQSLGEGTCPGMPDNNLP